MRQRPRGEIMVIGGAQIYRHCLPLASRIHLTLVHARVEEGDTFFDGWRGAEWRESSRERHEADEQELLRLQLHDARQGRIRREPRFDLARCARVVDIGERRRAFRQLGEQPRLDRATLQRRCGTGISWWNITIE